MKIIQKIETDDLIKYNQYLLSINISFKLSTIFLSLLAIIFGVASIAFEFAINRTVLPVTLFLSFVLIILGTFTLFGFEPIMKQVVKKRVIKKDQKIDDIAITMDEEGFKWEYADSEKNTREVAPYKWNQIEKVVEKETHIYIHVNKYIILYIKKYGCESIEEVKELLKEKMTYRYIEKIKA